MAEPDNIVLEHLRAIRAKLDEVDRKVDRLAASTDERFDENKVRLDGLTHAVIAGFGALVHEIEDLKGRVGRLERERA